MCAGFFLNISIWNLNHFVPLPTLNRTFPLSVHSSSVILSEFVFTFLTMIYLVCLKETWIASGLKKKEKKTSISTFASPSTDWYFLLFPANSSLLGGGGGEWSSFFFPFHPLLHPFICVLIPSLVPSDKSRTHQILACRSAAIPGVFFRADSAVRSSPSVAAAPHSGMVITWAACRRALSSKRLCRGGWGGRAWCRE